MGWWSHTIMGGDSPCDVRCAFEDIVREGNGLKEDEDSFETARFTAAQVNRVAGKLYLEAVSHDENEYESGIPGQVLGVFLMEAGARISKRAKAFILKSARADEWEDAPRKRIIKKFIRQVQTYKAKKPKKVPYESLGQKLAEHTRKQKTGLINL